jgi:hypothetical protein
MRNSASVRVADLLRAKTPPEITATGFDEVETETSTNLLVAKREVGDAPSFPPGLIQPGTDYAV